MNMCGATRLLVPAFLVGLAVATFAGNDLAGWVAAGMTVAILAVVQRARGTGGACAIPPGSAAETEGRVELGEAGPTDVPSR
jgi:hypothetical protein